MSPFDTLTDLFRKFPGIGPRQAKRFAYHVMRLSGSDTKRLADAIVAIKKSMRECADCHRYFFSENTSKLCSICSDPHREKDRLMIVATDSDLEAVEKSSAFKGLYFVLGGTAPLLEEIPSYIRKKELLERVKHLSAEGLKEIIVAMSVTADGDHTASYIKDILKPLVSEHISITSLGKGVSTGSELEYADSETLRNALSGRK